jgi:hypothetical protein
VLDTEHQHHGLLVADPELSTEVLVDLGPAGQLIDEVHELELTRLNQVEQRCAEERRIAHRIVPASQQQTTN